MKKQPMSLSTQADTLGLSYWATILNPNDEDYVDIFLMQPSSTSISPCASMPLRPLTSRL